MKRVLRALLIFGTLMILAYRVNSQLNHNSSQDQTINVIFAVFAFFILMAVLLVDQRRFSVLKTWKTFIPSMIGFTLTFFILGATFLLHKRDHSPVVIYAIGKQSTFSGLKLELKENKTYRLSNFDLNSSSFRGSYEIQDSLIILDRIVGNNSLVSKKLLIRSTKLQNREAAVQRMIYQIDDEGEVIENSLQLKIIDN